MNLGRYKGALAAALAILCVGAAAAAQSGSPAPQRPPRDAVGSEAAGTAVLRGRVIALDTTRPLRRAQVTIASGQLPSNGRRSTSTGLDGTFEFANLPAGRYRVSVTRSGYLPLQYGQTRPDELGRPVELREGETLEKIDFALPRMSVITGRITDELGEPIEGVAVVAMRMMFYEGRRRLVPVSELGARSDDVGEYRIPRLSPGSYVVQATTREKWTVRDNGVDTVFGYAPTYYPGVTSGADARRVTTKIGQESPAVDFSLVPGRGAAVSGTAIDSQGRPFSSVSMSIEVRGLHGASFGGGSSATVKPDGSFSFKDVTPGEYALSATRPPGSADGPPEAALANITVDGVDIENIALLGSEGGTVSGRVVVEDEPAPKMSSVRVLVGERLRSQPSPALLGTFSGTFGGSSVKDDGTFTVAHVFGRARFDVTLPDGWAVKTITHEGRDITDDVIDLESGRSLTGVQILLTNQLSSISGMLVAETGTPIRDATVLVFAEDAGRWTERSRWVRAARPDQQGRWEIKSLPPGEYLAIAQEYIEDGAWNDPEYLEGLRKSAEKITMAEGQTRTASLRITTPK